MTSEEMEALLVEILATPASASSDEGSVTNRSIDDILKALSAITVSSRPNGGIKTIATNLYNADLNG